MKKLHTKLGRQLKNYIAPWMFALIGIASVTVSVKAAEQKEAKDTLADYSHSIGLKLSDKQGVVALRLPQALYLHARSADLSDVRIFDANGDGVPFALYLPDAQRKIEKQVSEAKIFPIQIENGKGINAKSGSTNSIDLDIKTAADGAVVSVKTKSGANSRNSTLSGLILDLRGAERKDGKSVVQEFSALRFSLPSNIATYSAQIWLEVSDDLKTWDTVGAAELDWYQSENKESLVSDRLEFAPRRFRYARLTWRDGTPLLFAKVEAEAVQQTTVGPVLESLQIQAQPGREASDLVYPSAVAIPVEKLALQFAEPNVVLRGTLGQYRELPSAKIGGKNTWQFIGEWQSTFYQITQDGQVRKSSDVQVGVSHQAEWVLRTAGNKVVAKPRLTVYWQPATLIFLHGGKAPYTLAFGRDKVNSAALPIDQVAPGFSIKELSSVEQVQVGVLQQNKANENSATAAASAAQSAQQRQWILWGVLLLGVAVLAGMAWRLVKSMK